MININIINYYSYVAKKRGKEEEIEGNEKQHKTENHVFAKFINSPKNRIIPYDSTQSSLRIYKFLVQSRGNLKSTSFSAFKGLYIEI